MQTFAMEAMQTFATTISSNDSAHGKRDSQAGHVRKRRYMSLMISASRSVESAGVSASALRRFMTSM